MKLAIGVIFNGFDEEHKKLIESMSIAIAALQLVGGDAVIYAKLIEGASLAPDKSINILPMQDKLNRGFGISHNQMMRRSFSDGAADFYLCLNDDTILAPDSLVRLAEFVAEKEGIFLAECTQVPCEHPKPYDPLTLQTAWCSGAALLISKRIFELTGGFDENLFMYCEDVDLSWRARLYGAECYILPFARVFHRVKPQGEKPRAIVKQMFESARYLGYKWGAASFQELIEKKLIDGGFYPELIYLPAMPHISPKLVPKEFCEFRQELAFSIPRWR